MTFDKLLVEREGAVGVVTINRPRVLNALSIATLEQIGAAMQDMEADSGVRVVVLTGAGDKAFAAGADIAELSAIEHATRGRMLSEAFHRVGFIMAAMRKPVIAAINGYALGGGLEVAMCCDIRVAADTAQLGQPEINLGLIPGLGGTQRLARLVGAGRTKLLCMSGERISAEDALRMGLVDRIFPAAEFRTSWIQLALLLAGQAPLAIAAIKQAVDHGLDMSIQDGCMYEAALFGTITATADAREGTRAFLEKRKPIWTGK